MKRGNRTESLLRGKSAFERSLRRGFQRFSQVFRDPLRGRFPSQRLSVLLPLIVLPLSPIYILFWETQNFSEFFWHFPGDGFCGPQIAFLGKVMLTCWAAVNITQ